MKEVGPPPPYDAPVVVALVDRHDEAPPEAHVVLTTHEATVLLDAPEPELRLLRARGAILSPHEARDPSSRRIRSRLRSYLCPTRASILADVADDRGLSTVATILRSWSGPGVSYQALAETIRRADPEIQSPQDAETTRLLLALEHL